MINHQKVIEILYCFTIGGTHVQIPQENDVEFKKCIQNNFASFQVQQRSAVKKPKRPCLFCGVDQSNLPRHIRTKHKDDPLVKPYFDMNKKDSI